MPIIKLKAEYAERRAALKWWGWRTLIGVMIFWSLLLMFEPIVGFWAQKTGMSFWAYTKGFLYHSTVENMLFPFQFYGRWLEGFLFHEPPHLTWHSFFMWRLLLVPTFFFILYELWLMVLNPHTMAVQFFGSDHEARADEVAKMGLFDGKYLFLGLFQGKKIKLPDTRSVFCIGAPGCGKTTGVVVPAILEMNNASLIINDPKGELAKLTSGHRATLGPVFMMNWAGVDDKKKGIRWPSWNPIGGGNLPPLHAGREGYIDTLVSFLIPDGPKGTDPYWVKAGRGCLTGLTGYLCGKAEQANANDYFLARLAGEGLDDEDYAVLLSYYRSMRDFPEVLEAIHHAENKTITQETYLPIGKWGYIPESWHGKDASFAMLLDMITAAQVKINADLKVRRDQGDYAALSGDTWKVLMDDIVLETAYYGYGRRTLLELNQIASLPDKQRGSVLSMALSGINLFKNSAVRARTSMNDFNYDQLRGMKDPETGIFKPVTVYMSVPYEDLNSSILLSTLFINMAAGYLMEFGPNEGSCGPMPMGFMLDEFQHMPSLQSISDGIVFGRAKQNMFLVSVQDWHQISAKYGKEVSDVIMSSVAARIIKRHNNPTTRKPLLLGTGTLTKVIHSYSAKEGFIDLSGSIFSWDPKLPPFIDLWRPKKHSIKYKDDSVIGGSGIMSMADGKQLVLYSGHLRRGIRAETPLCFKNPTYKALSSLPKAPCMPNDISREDDDETMSSIQVNFDA